ncbi:MAG: efflux RND transporter permease subunit [Hyphomonadaceae bacterium]
MNASVRRCRKAPLSSSPTVTLFVDRAIQRVGQALFEATALVVLVIFLFLGSWRAAFIPAAVIPVCLIGAFLVMSMFGFTINLLTLLALVLAIGLVVDDSIVVLENAQSAASIHWVSRRWWRPSAARARVFAIVATSAVLVAVFALFVGGYVGALFVELAVTIAGVIVISAFAALSLSPMMCSEAAEAGEIEHAADALSIMRSTLCAHPTALRWKRRSTPR